MIDESDVRTIIRKVTKDYSIAKAREQGFTRKQIAERLGCSESTVMRSLKRCRHLYKQTDKTHGG